MTFKFREFPAGGRQNEFGFPLAKTIWIDLDNSPHVPFFLPIIEELRTKGYKVILTARDSYQVCDLVRFHGISCKIVGSHWGKNWFMKVVGTVLRAAQLIPWIMKEKPVLAVSHGSRAQILSSLATGVPIVEMIDYEHAANTSLLRPEWLLVPDVLPDSIAPKARCGVIKYPGLKEDVYVSRLTPDPTLREQLGMNPSDMVITVRPPASDAHYHNPESDRLLEATLEILAQKPDVRVILLPRNEKQATSLRKVWAGWIAKCKIVIPEQVIDGLNLIWCSDLVISGGGTMNREAAALGVPVYSIFRGEMGAVDQYLAKKGRLILLENIGDIQTKLMLSRRNRTARGAQANSATLEFIVDTIVSIVQSKCPLEWCEDH